MNYTIRIKKEAQKFIAKQDKKQQIRLIEAINNLPKRRYISTARRQK